MFCGTSSFHRDSSEDNTSSSPKGSSKKRSQRNKNPYSSRGLDKFTSVLSELEAKRDKILASTGAQGISMIRFMYSNSQDWIPIVVRLRDDRTTNNNSSNQEIVPAKLPEEVPAAAEKKAEKKAAAALPWWRWRSSYFVPAMAVLILVCLAVFGRVFAICCTSIWWYLVPNFTENTKRRGSRKKEYVKRLSDKRMVPAAAAAAQGKRVVQELGSPRGNHGKKLE